MLKTSEIRSLDLSSANNKGTCLQFGDDIFLFDNLDAKEDYTGPLSSPTPCRFMFLLYLVCVEGELDFNVDMRPYHLAKNDFAIIRSSCIFDDFRAADGSRGILVAISPTGKYTSDSSRSTLYLTRNLIDPLILHLSNDELVSFIGFYSHLKQVLMRKDNEFTGDAVHGMLLVMQSHFAQLQKSTEGIEDKSRRETASTEIMKKFLVLLGRNYSKERSIAFYAGKLCISPKYFAQSVFKASHRHAKDWINSYVIMDAKTMLSRGDLTVQEVSNSLNFANPSFFGKFFKTEVGISPKAFVKSLK